MKTPLAKRNRSKYYRFHWDYSHDMEDCYDLKEYIKELICWEHLGWFIQKHRKPHHDLKGRWRDRLKSLLGDPPQGEIVP